MVPRKKKKGKKHQKNGGITPRRRKFIDFFIENNNATKSARLAGYSKNTAGAAAGRLLQNVIILDEIERRRLEIAEQANICAQDVINEYAKMAFLKSSDVFSYDKTTITLDNGVEIVKGVALLKPHNELSIAADASIASIKETAQGGLEIKLYDKQKALDSLGKYFGISTEADVEKANKIKGAEKQPIVDPTEGLEESQIDDQISKLEE